MEEAENHLSKIPAPALLKLDLGANGGIFAPSTVEEMQIWVQKELEFWAWAQGIHTGSHKSAIDNAIQPLHIAVSHARDAATFQAQNQTNAVQERIQQVQANVLEAFVNRGLPHSSTPLAERVASLKVDPAAALAYLFPFLPVIPGNNYPFDARDTSSWRGFLMGLLDRFGIVTDVEPAIQAERQALEALHIRAEELLGEKRSTADQLARDYVKTTEAIASAKENQQRDFGELLASSGNAHKLALEKHSAEMDALRHTFREEMTLRGPVEYWQSKATTHNDKASNLMVWMFGSMAGLGIVLGLLAAWVSSSLNSEGRPDAWKVAVLALIGVLGVWAVRLVVRMFLSHTHLATDAEERVTMVKTYLALLEADKMPSDDDRKLVLTPLFRPATDGLVRDEGLPHPMLEMLTRAGQK